MGQVIVIASGKGGTGKTTVSTSLALALAKRNKKVLIIDCDSGMRGVDMMLGISDRLVYDVSDVVSGACKVENALYECNGVKELWCLAAPLSADDEVSPGVLKQLVDEIKADYDYVVIDSPAGVGSGFEAAAASADRALIVVNTEPTSIRGCLNIRTKLSELNINDVRLVINRFDRERFLLTGLYDDLDAVIDACTVQLIGIIPEDIRITALSQRGVLASNWAKSAVVFDTLAARIDGIDVPLIVR